MPKVLINDPALIVAKARLASRGNGHVILRVAFPDMTHGQRERVLDGRETVKRGDSGELTVVSTKRRAAS